MRFKFRDRVKVLAPTSKILRPDGHISQGEFFEGTTGTVIRHDPAKDGYLLVIDCPELSAIMGENITATFRDHELELVSTAKIPDQALPGPFEYPVDQSSTLTKEQILKRKERKARQDD